MDIKDDHKMYQGRLAGTGERKSPGRDAIEKSHHDLRSDLKAKVHHPNGGASKADPV